MTSTVQSDPRFQQMRARDAHADGSFVYAVRTTGVYCRPSCASRPARPENIVFYETPAQAEQAGFRPCKRCRPQQTALAPNKMQDLAAFIRDHADEALPLSRLSRQAGLSPAHLQRAFTAALGVSPKAYQSAHRLAAFKARLRAGDDVLGATFEAGYGSTSRIYEQVDGGLGMTPSAYRAGGAGEVITHAVRPTALGLLMMAATSRGVCFVQFGESADALTLQLGREFPRAILQHAPADSAPRLDAWMSALDRHLSAAAPAPDLPLDLRGTAFQIRVWRFLLSVRPGNVASYTEIAQGAGAPKAIRAAGSACGANRIAILVPCHRALRADGGLGGYRWGLDRKRALLDLERAAGSARP